MDETNGHSYKSADGTLLDGDVLTDGKFTGGVSIKRDSASGGAIEIAYGTPQTVRSLSTFLPGGAVPFNGLSLRVTFEASQGGKTWDPVAGGP